VLKALSRAAAHGDTAPEQRDVAPPEVELAPVLDLVERYRGVEDTVRRARELAEGAKTCIEPFPDGPGKRALVAAGEYAVGRDS